MTHRPGGARSRVLGGEDEDAVRSLLLDVVSMFVAIAGGAVLAFLGVLRADAQTDLCRSAGFAIAPATRVCSSSPVTVSATVRTYARLGLEDVFGRPAAGLQLAMGDIDAGCMAARQPGVACALDPVSDAATWFGDVTFRVTLSGIGSSRAKLVGARPAPGTIPVGRLLDGAAGSAPTAPYPVAPAGAANLRTAIGNGDTIVARSIGLKVLGSDPPDTWSGATIFSVVFE